MATTTEVKKLAALARITIADAELGTFTKEFDAILAYVGQLEKLELPPAGGGSASGGKPALRNVMRADGEPRMKSDFKRGESHSANNYTPALIEEFPAREGDALVVKQIITHE